MDFIEVEGKTYEEAIRKASQGLNVDEKDLDIDVKEVDTKGILGLLGSKKVRITARIKGSSIPHAEEVSPHTPPTPNETTDSPEAYGKQFLTELANIAGLD